MQTVVSGKMIPPGASQQEIERLLLAEFLKDATQMDMALIDEGMALLQGIDLAQERERMIRTLATIHARQDLRSVRRKRRVRKARVLLLIIVLLSLATAIGLALGYNIWKVAYQWTQEHLFLQLTPDAGFEAGKDEPNDDALYALNVWGDAVYELMRESDVHVELPSWMPEGFACENAMTVRSGGYLVLINANYCNANDARLALLIRSYSEEDAINGVEYDYQADYSIQDVLEINGRQFFIMSNLNRVSLTWMDGENGILTIAGDISSSDAERMARSVPIIEEERKNEAFENTGRLDSDGRTMYCFRDCERRRCR